MTRTVRHLFPLFAFLILGSAVRAQKWEFGGEFGVGLSDSPAIANPNGSVQSGFRTSGAASLVWARNASQYFGGELRYTFRSGGPKLTSGSLLASSGGYSNVITYDLVLHLDSRESRMRPYIAVGTGIKIFSSSGQESPSQPLAYAAILIPGTQIEPLVSTGGGLKYLLKPGIQLRLDFRLHLSPLPNDLIRPTARSAIHGWTYDLVPMVGIGYTF
jgi:hypothetical protein